jgi:hypothetical protein
MEYFQEVHETTQITGQNQTWKFVESFLTEKAVTEVRHVDTHVVLSFVCCSTGSTSKSPVVTICASLFSMLKFCVLPIECIYVFCMVLTINSAYFPGQNHPVGIRTGNV